MKYNLETITHANGDVIGIKVKRPTHSVYYHRTGRGIKQVFEPNQGELAPWVSTPDEFLAQFKNKAILDVGCGNGNLVSDLSKKGMNVEGIDLFLQPTQKSPHFEQVDAYHSHKRKTKYDLILTLWSVFHYEPLSQLRVLFQSLFESLKPKGQLVVPQISDPPRIEQFGRICKAEKISLQTDSKKLILVASKK